MLKYVLLESNTPELVQNNNIFGELVNFVRENEENVENGVSNRLRPIPKGSPADGQ